MAKLDQVKELLSRRNDVAEVQVQYTDGEVLDFEVNTADGDSATASLQSFLDGIDWDRVKEVEIGYANGDEYELDFDEEDEDDEEDDDDDDATREDDNEDDEDEDENEDDEEDDNEDDDDEDEEDDGV